MTAQKCDIRLAAANLAKFSDYPYLCTHKNIDLMKISLSNSVEAWKKKADSMMLPAFISFIFFLRQRQSSLVPQNGP